MANNQATINFDNVASRFALFSMNSFADGGTDLRRYVVSHDDTWKHVNAYERWPKFETLHVSYHEEDSDGEFFIFANADCAFPPHAIIRANSFEDAYETFCDEFSDWMKIEEPDLADYDEDSLNYSASGVPIDDSQVQGFQVHLVSIEC